MTHVFTLREAKARLSHLLDLVSAGETVEITRKGGKNDRFHLLAAGTRFPNREPGALRGQVNVPEPSDEDDPEIIEMFYGGRRAE